MNFFLILFIYFRLHRVCIAVIELSLAAASGGYSLVLGYRFLMVVTSLMAEHRF